MAGYTTHDGKITGNRQQVESYDASHGKKSAHMKDDGKAEPKAKKHAEHGGEPHEGGGSIHDIVAEHGPAHTHIHTIDRETGRHHSETHHEDGFIHHADHEGGLEEAHAHAGAAMEGHDTQDPFAAGQAEEQAEEEANPGLHKRLGLVS